MSRLTSSLLPLLSTLPLVVLTACPSAQTPIAQPTPEPVITEPDLAPTPPPPPRLTGPEESLVNNLIVSMYIDDIEVRRLAAEELGSLGPDARKALPELIHCAAAEDENDEPIESCAHSIIMIASGSDAHGLEALVWDFQLPLEIKERALFAMGELGGLATPAIATLYLDACERSIKATTAGARHHLEQTESLALAQLARSPASAKTFLDDERHGTCGQAGIEAVGAIAQR